MRRCTAMSAARRPRESPATRVTDSWSLLAGERSNNEASKSVGERARLSRFAGAINLTPGFDVNHDLSRRRAAQAAARWRDARHTHSAADVDAFLVLSLFHQPGDLDHRTFVGLDLSHHLLGPIHAKPHPFGDLEAAGLIRVARTGCEHVAVGASRNRDTDRILRHGLAGFLGSQRQQR